MKKTIAFIVLMFASQVALGDFLWSRGNEFRLQVQKPTILKKRVIDHKETSEARKEAIGQTFDMFVNNQKNEITAL